MLNWPDWFRLEVGQIRLLGSGFVGGRIMDFKFQFLTRGTCSNIYRIYCFFLTQKLLFLTAETWFSILFTIIVELVPAAIKTSIIGMTLFAMNIIGGNVTLAIDPLEKAIGYKEALYLFWPMLAAIGKVF